MLTFWFNRIIFLIRAEPTVYETSGSVRKSFEGLRFSGRKNVGNDSFTFRRFQPGATGHFLDYMRPLVGGVAGHSRECVTLDTSRREKSAAFLQRSERKLLLATDPCHLASHWRRRIFGEPTTDEQTRTHYECNAEIHNPMPRMART